MSWMVTQANDCHIFMMQNINVRLDMVRTIDSIVTQDFFQIFILFKVPEQVVQGVDLSAFAYYVLALQGNAYYQYYFKFISVYENTLYKYFHVHM